MSGELIRKCELWFGEASWSGAHLDQEHRPECVDESFSDPTWINASRGRGLDGAKREARVLRCEGFEQVSRRAVGIGDAAGSDDLVEGGEGVASRTAAHLYDVVNGGVVDVESCVCGDLTDHVGHLVCGDQGELEMLRTAPDRRDDLVGLGRGEDEGHVVRRFFEGLQQRVFRASREHVYLIEEVDLRASGGTKSDFGQQVTDVVDLVVGSRIELMEIETRARLDRYTRRARAVGFAVDWVLAVQNLREDSCGCCLAGSAGPAEQIRVADPFVADGVAKRFDYVFLAADLTKGLRPVPAIERLIGHPSTLSLKCDPIRAENVEVYTGLGVRPKEAVGKTSRRGAFNGTVVALGLTSFFTDISSEMVAAVIPIFLTVQLGFSPAAFGLFQAAYELANALLRMVGGMVADRTRRPKETAAFGYGLSTLTRVGLLGSAVASLPAVPFLLADRLGKGLRTGPRDAMISLATPERAWGTAFGFHRTLDATGALLGPLLAFGVLWALPGSFDAVFLLSIGFGMIGFAVIMTWVRNPVTALPRTDPPAMFAVREHWSNPGFRRILLLGGAFGLFSIGDSFAYLVILEASKGSTDIGLSEIGTRWFPLLFAGTAIGFLLTATPLGRLSDRIGRARVWVVGQLCLAGVYGVLLLEPTSVVMIVVVLGLLGLHYGATDGVLPALAAGVIPEHLRSGGLALLTTVVALSRMVSALGFGLIWERVGVDRALSVALGGMVATIVIVTVLAVFRESPNETD